MKAYVSSSSAQHQRDWRLRAECVRVQEKIVTEQAGMTVLSDPLLHFQGAYPVALDLYEMGLPVPGDPFQIQAYDW